MRRKLPIVLSLFFVLFLSLIPSNIAFAKKDDESKKNFDNGEVNRSMYAEDGERFYYKLEAGLPKDDKASWYDVIGKTADAISIGLNETVMLVNKIFFSLNVTFSKWLIGTLEMTQDFRFIDRAIDQVSSEVKDLVGVSGFARPSFTSSGMFSPLIKIIALVVVLYAFYQLVWKRSFIASFGELFKFIIVLATALLLFTNYSTFLTGMNNISTEIGNFVVGSQAKQNSHNTRVDKFSQTLWDHFVDRPYFTLQYGTSNLNVLGVDGIDGETRVRELLTAKTDSKERKDLVDKEINDRKNYYMSYDSVAEKTYTNMVFYVLNGITSIPIYMIALAIIFTQFWFIIIGMIAPFALLIASFPSQFNVLKRYFFELSLPLLIKIALHFVLVIIMFLTTLIHGVRSDINSDLFGGQIGTAFMNAVFYCMLFFAVFILRKRITNLLTSGSQMVGEIREGLGSVTTKPMKNTVQAGATIAGAAAGAMVAGPTGAMTGANIGATAGKIATGESGGVANTTQDIARTAYQYEALKHFSSKGKDGSEEELNLTPEQQEALDNKELEISERLEQGYQDTGEFLDEKGVDNKDAYIKEMDKQGVDFSKVSKKTLDRHYKEDEDGNVNPRQMAREIREHQDNERSRVNDLRNNRQEKFHDFMVDQNLNENEINDIYRHLEDKAIDVAHIPTSDYVEVDKDIRGRLEKGELLDYKEEFKAGLEERANARRLEKQKDRIIQGGSSQKPNLPEAPIAPMETADVESQNTEGPSLPTSTLENHDFQDSEIPPSTLENYDFQDSEIPPSTLENHDVQGYEIPSSSLENHDVRGYEIPPSSLENHDVQGYEIPPSTLENQGVQGSEVPTTTLESPDTKGPSIPPSSLDGRSVQGSNIPTSDLNGGKIENTPIHSNFESPKENLNRDNPAPEQKPKPKVEQPKVEQPKVDQPKKAPVDNKVDINSPSFVETDRSNINELNNTSYQEIETEKLD